MFNSPRLGLDLKPNVCILCAYPVRICVPDSFDFVKTAYEVRLGTVDQTEADVEWLLRPYQRTAKKRNYI